MHMSVQIIRKIPLHICLFGDVLTREMVFYFQVWGWKIPALGIAWHRVRRMICHGRFG